MEQENIPLLKQVEMLKQQVAMGQPQPIIKEKKIKLPSRAKAKRGKIKKGWIGIISIDENGGIKGEKQKVEDSTIRLKDGSYHALDGEEILFWEGKFPVIIQPTWKLNPLKLRKKEGEKDEAKANQTYGQKYVMARMLGDTIKVKAKSMGILIWALLIGGILFAVNYFTGAA